MAAGSVSPVPQLCPRRKTVVAFTRHGFNSTASGANVGIITTTNGDVWALDNEKDQIVYLPKGDASKGRILGRTVNGKPVDGTLRVKGPFHLAVDQQDRIWITNGGSDTVTRFPASDPGNAEEIKVGFGPRAVAIDSLGNAWVCNTIGHPGTKEKLDFIMEKLKSKVESIGGSAPKADSAAKMWHDLYELLVKFPGAGHFALAIGFGARCRNRVNSDATFQ